MTPLNTRVVLGAGRAYAGPGRPLVVCGAVPALLSSPAAPPPSVVGQAYIPVPGPRGTKGDKGDRGDQGEPGLDGADGANGADATHPDIDFLMYYLLERG